MLLENKIQKLMNEIWKYGKILQVEAHIYPFKSIYVTFCNSNADYIADKTLIFPFITILDLIRKIFIEEMPILFIGEKSPRKSSSEDKITQK